MKTSIIPDLEKGYNSSSIETKNDSINYSLKWRMGQLLVLHPGQNKQPHLPAFDCTEKLVDCLKHSPVKIVRVDPRLGEVRVKTWTEACAQAKKPIYLNISSLEKHLQSPSNFSKPLKQSVEWLVALLLLIVLSPIFLGLIALMQIYSPGELFSHTWHVGRRGRIFQLAKFRTPNLSCFSDEDVTLPQYKQTNLTPFGSFLQKSGLENLPQLLNVLRGEIGLFGHRGWSLEAAIVQNREFLRRGKGLLGISGTWQVEPESNLLHLDSQTL